jgi:amino acid adenylation domain-containing protein
VTGRAAVAPDRTDGRSLRSGFLKYASETPDAPALFVRGATLSYAALEAKARTWAAAILGALGRPARRVGVFAYRSEESYAGVLAALMSAAAFVPLNRAFPPKRTALMMERADLDAVIVDSASAAQLDEVFAAMKARPLVLFPAGERPALPPAGARVLSRPDIEALGPLEQLPALLPDDIAYLLFTSGSTGEPKGVCVSHANALHFMDVISKRYSINSGDRISQTFDPTFDPFVFDLFSAWENGACVYSMQPIDLLVPDRFVREHKLTMWCSVPSVPVLMRKKNLLTPGSMPTLRWSSFGGEALPAAIAQAWQEAAPASRIENLYGPTELTIACFAYRWDPASSPALCVHEAVPIGRPFEGNAAAVVDDDLCPVPPGTPGELLVCGPQTVPGYWRDDQKTRERFVHLDGPAFEGLRFYRTGDRVMRLAGGDYVYLGRVDHQLKVLGHRVELGEIEAVLRQAAAVDEAVALGWPMASGAAQGIVAFLTGSNLDPAKIKAAAQERLPDYMVPRRIFVIDKMPVNANGKTDRNALLKRLESSDPPA